MGRNGYEKFFHEAKKVKQASTPEDVLREHLFRKADAQRQKKKTQLRKSQKPSRLFWGAMIFCGLSAATLGFLNPDILEGVSELDIGVSVFGQAGAQEEAVKENKSPEKSAENSQPAKSATVKSAEAKAKETLNISEWSAEELSVFNKLNDRKKELDQREAEIARLETELQRQRDEIEERLKKLEATRQQISDVLKGRVEQDQEQVKKLVDVYSNMKPTQASRIIESLNEDLAMEILDKMKKKNAAEILNTMNAAKARKLSELLTGYRQPASEKSQDDVSASN